MTGLFEPTPKPTGRDAILIAAYELAGRTLDDLPYTREFTQLHDDVRRHEPHALQADVFHRLQNLRKAGKLPKLGKGHSTPPAIRQDEEEFLAQIVIDACGTLGQRDQLLYTPKFDDLVHAFNARTQRALSPHDVWRLIAKIAK